MTSTPRMARRADPRRGWALLVRNGRLILACTALALLAGAVIAFRIPRTWQASASIALEPAGNAADDANRVATAMAVLTSNALAREVAESLGTRLGVGAADAPAFIRANTLVTQPDARASVLVVSWRGTDARLARDVADRLASVYLRRNRAAEQARSRGDMAAMRQQLEALDGDTRARERATNAWLRAHPLADDGADGARAAAELDRLAELRAATADDRDLLAATLNAITLSAATGDASDVERLFSSAPFMRAQSAIGSAAALEARLRAQQDRRAQLLTRLDRNDPDVKSVERQIESTRHDVRAVAEGFVAGLSEQVRRYDSRMREIRSDAQGGSARRITLARLQREQQRADEQASAMRARLADAAIAAAARPASAQLLDAAELPRQPTDGARQELLALWMLSGVVVGCCTAVVRDRFDPTVHDERDVMEMVRLPVIGIIPLLRPRGLRPVRGGGAAVAIVAGHSRRGAGRHVAVAEAYRALRTNLAHANPARPPRVIVITSPLSGDGKTTSAANLAVTLAQQGKRVLLVDAETRHGNLHQLFGIDAAPGFFDLLYGQSPASECIRRVRVEGTELDLLPSGGEPNSNAADLLVPGIVAPFIAALRAQYDYVLIDTPPLNLFTDAALIGAEADATLLVARAGRTDREALRVAMQQLHHVQAHVAGAILNGVELSRNSRYQGGHELGRYASTWMQDRER